MDVEVKHLRARNDELAKQLLEKSQKRELNKEVRVLKGAISKKEKDIDTLRAAVDKLKEEFLKNVRRSACN